VWLFGLAFWACSLISLSCEPGPDVSIIQTAYELGAASSNSLHDNGLKVLNAKCHDNAGERAGDSFICEVTFISTGDLTERLYFDIVSVARKGSQWELTSGLCKR
jgi:hypothetical protein